MEPTKVQLLKVRLQGFKKALDAASENLKRDNISMDVANNFNTILDEITENYPSVKDSLPKRVQARRFVRREGKANICFLDLTIFVEQVIGILDILDSGE